MFLFKRKWFTKEQEERIDKTKLERNGAFESQLMTLHFNYPPNSKMYFGSINDEIPPEAEIEIDSPLGKLFNNPKTSEAWQQYLRIIRSLNKQK